MRRPLRSVLAIAEREQPSPFRFQTAQLTQFQFNYSSMQAHSFDGVMIFQSSNQRFTHHNQRHYTEEKQLSWQNPPTEIPVLCCYKSNIYKYTNRPSPTPFRTLRWTSCRNEGNLTSPRCIQYKDCVCSTIEAASSNRTYAEGNRSMVAM